MRKKRFLVDDLTLYVIDKKTGTIVGSLTRQGYELIKESQAEECVVNIKIANSQEIIRVQHERNRRTEG